MFKIKTKLKDNIIVKGNMYFMYGLTVFKTSEIVDNQLRIAYYDEPSGNLHTISEPYSIKFLQGAILRGQYTVVTPGFEFTVPDKLRDYVVQYQVEN